MELLRHEAELQVSVEIQEAMKKTENSVDSKWMDVIDSLQLHIVQDYHASTSTGGSSICVRDLRKAAP